MILLNMEGFKLCKEKDFYYIILPNNETMVNASGTKEELINELKRWKAEIDYNHYYMLDIEDQFINILESL